MWPLNRKDDKKKVRGNADPEISSLSSPITDIINRVTVREGTGLETIIKDSFGGNVQFRQFGSACWRCSALCEMWVSGSRERLRRQIRVGRVFKVLRADSMDKMNMGKPKELAEGCLGDSSGHDLTVCESEPRIGLCADGAKPAWDFLSPSLSLCPSPALSCSLKNK